jgi:hypothetical protein
MPHATVERFHEQATLAEAVASGSAAAGRMLIQVITPGQGSSGYYSPAVCEAAAPLVRAGTPMYLDHPTESEDFERPERSLRDLVAVFTGVGQWDADRQAVVAEARVFAPYREVISEMAPYIGVSVRGDGRIVEGDVNGTRRKVVESISKIMSVDFVTAAGRGGRVLELLESARVQESRNIGQWVESRIHRDFTVMADDMAGDGRLTREERIQMSSAIGDALAAFVSNLEANAPQLYQRDLWDDPRDTVAAALEAAGRRVPIKVTEALPGGMTANDLRDALCDAVKQAYPAADVYAWVRDYTDTWVVFEVDGDTPDKGTFRQSYTVTDADVTLADDRTEVQSVTTYVPVNPAGRTTTQESEEDTMPNIEESELAQLREAAGRVSTLESERDTERQGRVAAERQLAESTARETARTRARTRVTEANSALPAATVDRIVAAATATVPLTEAGVLDQAAFDTRVDEARTSEETYLASLAEASGAGRVVGLGGFPIAESGEEQKLRESNDKQRAAMFGRQSKEA